MIIHENSQTRVENIKAEKHENLKQWVKRQDILEHGIICPDCAEKLTSVDKWWHFWHDPYSTVNYKCENCNIKHTYFRPTMGY